MKDPAAPPEPPTGSTSPERVLLVEDDPDSLELMGQIVEAAGYQVERAASGFQALAMAGEARYDVVLLDVMLPGVDGFEVCHRLRREPATADLPIILISAKGRDEDVETGKRVGANAYLMKPISRTDLLAAIRKQINSRKAAP